MTFTNMAAIPREAKVLIGCLLTLLMLAAVMHYYALPHRGPITAKNKEGRSAIVQVPSILGIKETGSGPFEYSFELDYNHWPMQQTGFQIIPNGCIRKILVNDKPVPFRGRGGCNPVPRSHWDPYIPPIYTDLARELKAGKNKIVIKSDKSEFSIGPVIFYNSLKPAKWLGILMALTVCIALFKMMQWHNRDRASGYIVAAGFLLHLQRFSHWSFMERGMDIPGHLIYIHYIANKLRWPGPYDGWSYYHPPLYYTIEALIMRYANWLGTYDATTLMQTFSLICFTVFMVFGAFTLRRLIRNATAYYTAITLLIFYPSGILFSAHIDSHLLFYACYAVCIYFLLLWMQHGRYRYLGIALAAIGFGIATRSNALILMPLAVLALYYAIGKGFVSNALWRSRALKIGLVLLCIGMAMNFGRTQYYRISENRNEPLIVGNIFRLSQGLRIDNENILRMLTPNIPHYITHPLWSVWSDAEGRQYFWNSMLKSSISGEYVWDKRGLALRAGNLLLLLIVYLADAYIIHRRTLRKRPEWMICFVSLSVAVFALFMNRRLYPYACSEDFRYIYPALISFCGLVGLAIEQHSNDWRPFRKWLGVAIALSFSWSAVRFYT